MGSHINEKGEFQSDKYPTCPPGKVPLSVKDKMAQDLLWIYAQRRKEVDKEFSEDLKNCLSSAGYEAGDEKTANAYAAYLIARSSCAVSKTPNGYTWSLGERYASALGVYHHQRAIEPLSYDDLIAAINKAFAEEWS